MVSRFIIKEKKLLFTEGKDDVALFKEFLDNLGINDVQVEGVNGISNFMEKLSGIFKLPNFKKIFFLGVIRDAEKNERNPQNSARYAYESIFNILKRNKRIEKLLGKKVDLKYMNKWKHNVISVGIFITCKPGCSYGMLEDLCLDHIKGTLEMRCVDKFLRCVRGDSIEPNYLDYFKIPSKNKILAFLASQAEPHGSIHVAAAKGIWDVFNPSFNELKNFLEGFRMVQ